MEHSTPLQKRLRAGALLAACGLGASWAQGAEPVASFTTPLAFDSVIAQFPAHEEQAVAPWRETNDTVEKIGGWAAYAKEAQMPDPEMNKPKLMTDRPTMGKEQGQKP